MAGTELDIYDDDGSFSSAKVARIYEESKSWPTERKRAAMAYMESAASREKIKRKYRNTAEIAHAVDPDFTVTPALSLIADSIETVLSAPRRNLIVTMPPQEGKSTLCAVFAPIRAWQLNPNRRIILATYGDDLALAHSATCRGWIERYGTGVTDPLTGLAVDDKIGLRVSRKSRRMDAWGIDGGKGGMVAAGLGSAITGRAADLFIIDDPYKNMQEADSASHRAKVDEWMASVALTRLSPQASMILVQCMTGDTPVRRPDGTETPLADIRPGDRIATYEDGALSTSTVRNWASQGLDDVLCIRMMSGRTVRANARHPFLVIEDGKEVWRRVSELKPGNKCRAAHGPAPSVAPTGATSPQSARGCATPTTTRRAGPKVSGIHLTVVDHAGTSSCGSDMGSTMTSTTVSLLRRMADALSAAASPTSATCRSTGTATSASITAGTQAVFVDSSATPAISPSDGYSILPSERGLPPTIWTDEIVAIEPAGVAEVFDIQVDRTENFIANGLVSHNTRWHPEDLAGKVLEGEKLLDPEHRTWRHLNIPAISQEGIEDSLGREPGTAMVSARGRTKPEFEQTRRQVGERVWFAMYQGSPRNPEGGLFERKWFEPRVDVVPDHPVAAVVAIDPADSGEGDETGLLGAILSPTGEIIFTEDWSGQFTSDQWASKAVEMALTLGAREIVLEGYSTFNTYRNVVKSAWKDAHREAREALAAGKDLNSLQLRALTPNMPFIVGKYTETGDAEGRSALLRMDFERKRARVMDYKLGVFIDQAADWQTGMHCPDRVAAAVIAHWRLDQLGSGRVQYGHPLQDRVAGPPSERLTRRVSDPAPGGLPLPSRGIAPSSRALDRF
jgi:hypothetical protein